MTSRVARETPPVHLGVNQAALTPRDVQDSDLLLLKAQEIVPSEPSLAALGLSATVASQVSMWSVRKEVSLGGQGILWLALKMQLGESECMDFFCYFVS